MPRAPGDAFGRAADDYELGRPEWPEAIVERAVVELGLGPDAEVLDLAAGTGKLTRLLVPRVGRVVAVEPDGEMRAILARLVPAAEDVPGTGEELPFPDGSVDAVFVGEAFHWLDGGRALREIARSGVWREGFAVGPFEPLRETALEYEEVVGAEEVVAYVLSISSVASLPADDRRAVGQRLRELVPPRRYRRFLRADLYWTRRKA